MLLYIFIDDKNVGIIINSWNGAFVIHDLLWEVEWGMEWVTTT